MLLYDWLSYLPITIFPPPLSFWDRKHALNCHRMKPALFSVLCEIKEKTGESRPPIAWCQGRHGYRVWWMRSGPLVSRATGLAFFFFFFRRMSGDCVGVTATVLGKLQ